MTINVKISKRLISYEYAFKFLQKRVEQVKKGKKEELLWILEHPLTYTGGIRSLKEEILNKKIKIIKTNRGGKITLHSPGQKIIYFVLDLNKRKKDIRNLIKIIEKNIVQFLKLYKIKALPDKENIGIWVKGKKIAAIGVRVSKWVAYHGYSININNNLDFYKNITPCGLNNKKITSVERQTKKKVSEIEVKLKKIFLENLKNI